MALRGVRLLPLLRRLRLRHVLEQGVPLCAPPRPAGGGVVSADRVWLLIAIGGSSLAGLAVLGAVIAQIVWRCYDQAVICAAWLALIIFCIGSMAVWL